ncbi:MAG: metal-dependent transcriptional regulator [Clostridia bacterium]|nr:metal-dependent transcriptional regulator [Clostridia bacterium]
MALYQSGEMYLETIYVLAKTENRIRSLDVAEHMGYSKPSVSRAVKRLREDGYILMDEDGLLTLTESGAQIAAKIYERHTVLTEILMRIGVDRKTAADDACRIEHVISDAAFNAMKQHLAQHTKG